MEKMTEEEKIKLDRHTQVLDQLVKSNETLFNITSKLNGEYIKMDKEGDKFKTEFSKDLGFIKQEVEKGTRDNKEIKQKLDVVIEGYVKREEFEARFGRLQDEIDGRIEGVNDRISTKTDTDRFNEFAESIHKAVDSLMDNNKWIARVVIGTLVTAILGGVMGGIFLVK